MSNVATLIFTIIAQRNELEKPPHPGGFLVPSASVLGQLAKACPHPADRHRPRRPQV